MYSNLNLKIYFLINLNEFFFKFSFKNIYMIYIYDDIFDFSIDFKTKHKNCYAIEALSNYK